MIQVELIYNTGNQLTVYLSARTGSQGTPAFDGYIAEEVEPGKYVVTIPDQLIGEFDIWATDAMKFLVYRAYILLDIVEGIYRPSQLPSGDGSKPFTDDDFGCKVTPAGILSGTTNRISKVVTPVEPEKTKMDLCTDARQHPGYVLHADVQPGLLWDLRTNDGEVVPAIIPGIIFISSQSLDILVEGEFKWVDTPEVNLDIGGEFNYLETHIEVSGSWIWNSARVPDRLLDLTCHPSRIALFRNPFCSNSTFKAQLQTRNGRVLIVPPEQVTKNPGIYQLEVIWSQNNYQHFGLSLVSVEQSLLNRATTRGNPGPLTVDKIRSRLRDFPELNDSFSYEFSIKELLNAILDPLEYYNETPPYSDTYSANNFPYRQRWLDATVSRLLHMQAQGLFRNQVEIQAEGLMADSRAKYHRMLQIADMLWKEYQQFVIADKARKSAQYGYRRF